MNARRIVAGKSLICAALMAACSKQIVPHVSEHRYLNACTLLTADQIRSVQGVPLKEARSSGSGGPDFAISQCDFTTIHPGESVTLTITRQGKAPGHAAARASWNETFRHGDNGGERGGMASAEEARNWAPPEEITGLGDEAFWVPNQFGGALYVLKQECHIRISISGSSDPETKRHNSRALAAFVLDRL